MSGERVTRNQLGCLQAVDQHGSLRAGWGGYSLATMRSLDRRGLLREQSGTGDRFSITDAGARIARSDSPRLSD